MTTTNGKGPKRSSPDQGDTDLSGCALLLGLMVLVWAGIAVAVIIALELGR